MQQENEIQIWGGIECTINRVKDAYFDQLAYSGHYERDEDIDLVASLGVKMLRYPVLWEKTQPIKDGPIDWAFSDKRLHMLRDRGITPIIGLVHHGSGPAYVNFFDGSFENGLEAYARNVAERYPWAEYYTPVNEPLTTARFCGLYGHWYPHTKDYFHFFKILLSECKATVLAMNAIREVNPAAKLIQTEDLGKCHSTPLLQYQADLENERRWLSYDLLCGMLTPDKMMYQFMLKKGITQEELNWFLDNPCVPHIAGFNYYLTSERYLDEDKRKYPRCYHGGNEFHKYADVHTVHVPMEGKATGPEVLLKEAWHRFKIPLAITECHLHSTREDQIRWFHRIWETVNKVKEEGVDIRAITAWAIFGLTGWNRLCTKPGGVYEPGVFNVSSGYPRPTALARYLQTLTRHKVYYHPILENEGWWQRENRLLYGMNKVVQMKNNRLSKSCRPLLILGQTGTLGNAFSRICDERNIHHLLLNRTAMDITDVSSIEKAVQKLKPWGIINSAGYVRVDDAEKESDACLESNGHGPSLLASVCQRMGIQFLTFSSDLVFDGEKNKPYFESDPTYPLNVYGQSKVWAEEKVVENNPEAIIIRTSSFFGPWDRYNFVTQTLNELKEGREVQAINDIKMSPTYVPDLVHRSLDLLLDHEQGIFHVTNEGAISWAGLARKVAVLAGYDPALIKDISVKDLVLPAKRPSYSVLKSEKGIKLLTLNNALDRYFEALSAIYLSEKIAV